LWGSWATSHLMRRRSSSSGSPPPLLFPSSEATSTLSPTQRPPKHPGPGQGGLKLKLLYLHRGCHYCSAGNEERDSTFIHGWCGEVALKAMTAREEREGSCSAFGGWRESLASPWGPSPNSDASGLMCVHLTIMSATNQPKNVST
jgi:hypothetical protein